MHTHRRRGSSSAALAPIQLSQYKLSSVSAESMSVASTLSPESRVLASNRGERRSLRRKEETHRILMHEQQSSHNVVAANMQHKSKRERKKTGLSQQNALLSSSVVTADYLSYELRHARQFLYGLVRVRCHRDAYMAHRAHCRSWIIPMLN